MYACGDLDEVRDESTRWLYQYNHDRPHLALDRKPPMTYRMQYEEERARVAEPSGRYAPSGLSNSDQP